MVHLTRRRFVKVGLSLLPTTAIALVDLPPHVFVSESGTTQQGMPAVVGFLFTRDPDPDPGRWKTLRTKLDYHRELRYRGTDRSKIRYAQEMIRYYVSNDDLTFTAIVSTIQSNSEGPDRQSAISKAYPEMLRMVGARDGMKLYVKGRPRELRQRLEQIKAMKITLTCVPVKRRERPLMELTGLLVGCVGRQFSDGNHNSNGEVFAKSLQEALGSSRLRVSAGRKWTLKSLAIG